MFIKKCKSRKIEFELENTFAGKKKFFSAAQIFASAEKLGLKNIEKISSNKEYFKAMLHLRMFVKYGAFRLPQGKGLSEYKSLQLLLETQILLLVKENKLSYLPKFTCIAKVKTMGELRRFFNKSATNLDKAQAMLNCWEYFKQQEHGEKIIAEILVDDFANLCCVKMTEAERQDFRNYLQDSQEIFVNDYEYRMQVANYHLENKNYVNVVANLANYLFAKKALSCKQLDSKGYIDYRSFANILELRLFERYCEPKRKAAFMAFDWAYGWHLVAKALTCLGLNELALQLLEKIDHINPVNVDILFAEATLYRKQGKLEIFIDITQSCYEKIYQSCHLSKYYANFAYYFVEQGNCKDAANLCHLSLFYDKNNYGAQALLFKIASKLGKKPVEAEIEKIKAVLKKHGLPFGASPYVLKLFPKVLEQMKNTGTEYIKLLHIYNELVKDKNL